MVVGDLLSFRLAAGYPPPPRDTASTFLLVLHGGCDWGSGGGDPEGLIVLIDCQARLIVRYCVVGMVVGDLLAFRLSPGIPMGGKAGLFVRKHDHFKPTREIGRRHQGSMALRLGVRDTSRG